VSRFDSGECGWMAGCTGGQWDRGCCAYWLRLTGPAVGLAWLDWGFVENWMGGCLRTLESGTYSVACKVC
jgi:hypothetical protein